MHDTYAFFSQLSIPVAILFMLPFILLLLSIAITPLIFPLFWEKNRNKAIISAVFGLPVAAFFIFTDWHIMFKTFLEYATFIGLLTSLFIISGGIHIRGSFKGEPAINTAFLGIGALLANLIGTTGASVLLIRPLIRANHERRKKAHTIIFFIFIVSNCSGLLTPLGDPPLFLGFIKGVDFMWTFRLFPQFLLITTSLLIIYYFLDRYHFIRECNDACQAVLKKEPVLSERFSIEGRRNFILLFMIIVTNIFAGYVIYPKEGHLILGEPFGVIISQITQLSVFLMLSMLSYYITPNRIHDANHFQFRPIVEVAVLFAGIFAAMVPALIILEIWGGRFGITNMWQFFWLTGGLSSFLDNAPTYLTFTSLAKGVLGLAGSGLSELAAHPAGQKILAAISCGAVMMGANTYIGNGPNFMVKAIAEHAKIKMPSFFHYMLWSLSVLIPIFILLTWIFFMGQV